MPSLQRNTQSFQGRLKQLLTSGWLKTLLIVIYLASIYDAILAERTSGIQAHPAPDFGDSDESLGAIFLRTVTNFPAQSKAKDLLLGYAGR